MAMRLKYKLGGHIMYNRSNIFQVFLTGTKFIAGIAKRTCVAKSTVETFYVNFRTIDKNITRNQVKIFINENIERWKSKN